MLLVPLRPNANKAREIREWLKDIARREGTTPEAVLKKILAQIPEGDPPHRLQEVRMELTKLRYPAYMKKKEEFEKILNSLKLGANFQINPSPFFEESFIEIKLRIGSEEEKKEIIRVLEKEEWKQLFDFLS